MGKHDEHGVYIRAPRSVRGMTQPGKTIQHVHIVFIVRLSLLMTV